MEIQALRTSRSRRLHWFAGLAVALVTWPALGTNNAVEEKSYLYPEQRHERIGELVTQFIEKQHYNRIAVDDDLSSDVMDLFIESLDRNRMYLLKGDVDFFETYRYQLDDMVRGRSLAPVFEMYEVYQTRARERMQFALEALSEAWEHPAPCVRAAAQYAVGRLALAEHAGQVVAGLASDDPAVARAAACALVRVCEQVLDPAVC